MTAADIAQLLALAATVLAASSLAMLFVLNRRLKRLTRQQRVILGSRGETDLIGHIADLDGKVDHLRMALEDLAVTAKDHEIRIDGCLARVGMVRFDAYEDLGGRQSSSVAFLDARENGLVITTTVSREFARMYVKNIRDGRPDVPLAPEETEAVDQARSRGAAPFTVRPRLEQILRERGVEPAEMEPVPDQADPDEEEAALRTLERENRRRARRGLPALEEMPPAPSSMGWAGIEPPASPPPPEQAHLHQDQPLPEEIASADAPPEQPAASDLHDEEEDTALHWAPEWEDVPPRDRPAAAKGQVP